MGTWECDTVQWYIPEDLSFRVLVVPPQMISVQTTAQQEERKTSKHEMQVINRKDISQRKLPGNIAV